MKTWQELLLGKHYPPERMGEYGANGAQACAAIDAVAEIDWCCNVGAPIESSSITRVPSWQEVVQVIRQSWDQDPHPSEFDPDTGEFRPATEFKGGYKYSGHIGAAVERCRAAPWDDPESHPPGSELYERFMLGGKLFGRLSRSWGHVFPDLALDDADESIILVYVNHWMRFLASEIITSDQVDCTHFREQLQWFYAGNFPCGWDGDWPVGKMKVF